MVKKVGETVALDPNRVKQVRFKERGIHFGQTVLASANVEKNKIEIMANDHFVFLKDQKTGQKSKVPMSHVEQIEYYPDETE